LPQVEQVPNNSGEHGVEVEQVPNNSGEHGVEVEQVPNNSGEHGVARTNYRNIMRHVEEKKFKEKCNKERSTYTCMIYIFFSRQYMYII